MPKKDYMKITDSDDEVEATPYMPRPSGKIKKKGKKSKSKSTTGRRWKKWRKKMTGVNRSFRVVRADGASQEYGYFKGRTPSQAASKAATRYLRTTNKKMMTITMRDITKGGKGREYNYTIERLRSAGKLPGSSIKFHYKNRVRSGGKTSNLK
jgi:hypothetical protein